MSKFKRAVTKVLPYVLTGAGVAGTIGAVILAAKEGPKYQKALEENKDMTLRQKILTAGKIFAPAIGCTILSSACQIGSLGLGMHTQANIAGAYIALQEMYKKYRKENVKLNGIEADDAIIAEIEKKPEIEQPKSETDISDDKVKSEEMQGMPKLDKHGEVIHKFYFPLTDQEFEASWREYANAKEIVDKFINQLGFCVVNDILDMFNLPYDLDCGEQGWCREMFDCNYTDDNSDDYDSSGWAHLEWDEIENQTGPDGDDVIVICPKIAPINLEEWEYYSSCQESYTQRSNDICEKLLKKGE